MRSNGDRNAPLATLAASPSSQLSMDTVAARKLRDYDKQIYIFLTQNLVNNPSSCTRLSPIVTTDNRRRRSCGSKTAAPALPSYPATAIICR